MAERPSSKGLAAPEPSPAARELLRAFRDHESPSASARDEGFAALRSRLELEASATSAAANGRFYGIAKATLVTVAVAAAVLLAIKAVGSGVTALADQARQPALEAPYHGEAGADGGQAVARAPRLLPRRSDGAPAETAETTEPQPTAVTEPTVRDAAAASDADGSPDSSGASSTGSGARSSRPRVAASSTTPATTADALEEELALIKRATEAKKTRAWADGLAALREHAQRFPRGVLADERMVLKAELHCGAGRVQEADALVESFLRARAGSALAGRMRNVCRE